MPNSTPGRPADGRHLPLTGPSGANPRPLVAALRSAYDSLLSARAAVSNAGPNGRTYALEPSRYEAATAEHSRRLSLIDSLLADLDADMADLQNPPGRPAATAPIHTMPRLIDSSHRRNSGRASPISSADFRPAPHRRY